MLWRSRRKIDGGEANADSKKTEENKEKKLQMRLLIN